MQNYKESPTHTNKMTGKKGLTIHRARSTDRLRAAKPTAWPGPGPLCLPRHPGLCAVKIQNGPYGISIRPVSRCKTGRIATRKRPFCKTPSAEAAGNGHFVKSIYRHSRVTPRMQRQSTWLFPMFFSIHPDATGNTRHRLTKPCRNGIIEHIILQKEFSCVKDDILIGIY